METRHRRRGGKSARAVASDPPVRPPSPVSESAMESEGESEAELTDIGATGVRDRDPPTTTLPEDDYQTPPAGARARTEGALAAAPPSPASLAQGGLATPGGELRGPQVVTVDPASPQALGAEAIAPAKSPHPSAGQQGPQAVEVPSPTLVEQPDTLPFKVTAKTTQTLTLDPQTLTQVKPRTLTLDPETRTLTFI